MRSPRSRRSLRIAGRTRSRIVRTCLRIGRRRRRPGDAWRRRRGRDAAGGRGWCSRPPRRARPCRAAARDRPPPSPPRAGSDRTAGRAHRSCGRRSAPACASGHARWRGRLRSAPHPRRSPERAARRRRSSAADCPRPRAARAQNPQSRIAAPPPPCARPGVACSRHPPARAADDRARTRSRRSALPDRSASAATTSSTMWWGMRTSFPLGRLRELVAVDDELTVTHRDRRRCRRP